jgi:glycosidase
MRRMQLNRFFFLILICSGISTHAQINANKTWSTTEIIYHLFQRSFYDSNGDLQGDPNGIVSKLDYLQDLGVTSILLLPLYKSVYYHNYFADDFEKIGEECGTMQDFLDLVKAAHQRGMKTYLDMETQYVTEDHIWWKDSYNNLSSAYSDYILYDDAAHTKPSTIVFGLERANWI